MAAAGGIEDEVAGGVDFAPAGTEADVGPAVFKATGFLVAGGNGEGTLGIDVAPASIPTDGGEAFGEIGTVFVERVDAPMAVLVDEAPLFDGLDGGEAADESAGLRKLRVDNGFALLIDEAPEFAKVHGDELDVFGELPLFLNDFPGFDDLFEFFFGFVAETFWLVLVTVRVPDFDQIEIGGADFLDGAHGTHFKDGVGAGEGLGDWGGDAAQIGVSA